MTGLSPGSVLPLFYGAGPESLRLFGFEFPPDAKLFADTGSPSRRNLFGPAPPGEIYRGLGTHLEQQAATRQMLEELVIHMIKCPWPGEKYGDENRKIPAGYTYLAQLAAHDLVSNIAPLPRPEEVPSYFARDYRSNTLILDTIYGGGPITTPLPFEIDRDQQNQRHRLRLGYVPAIEPVLGKPRPTPMTHQPARDIGRAACPHLSDDHGIPRAGVPDALLADPRNDDHLIISQLTALFHELHNIVDRKLTAPGEELLPPNEFRTYRRFLDARKTVAYVYRKVIIEDLLKLLLESGVYEYYASPTTCYPDDFLDKENDGRVPVEFSHAAYRFGHVMVRFKYRLNDRRRNGDEPADSFIGELLDRSSARHPELLPVACTWLVDWTRFFDLKLKDQPEINFSRLIRPRIGIGQLSGNSHFPNEDGRKGGIFYRDLIRGADAGVRTVDSLIAGLRRSERKRSRLLWDRGYRQQEIHKWLTQCPKHQFCDADRFSLTQDPPLLFFVLFEAAHCQNGERLGILGSTIVAEVFFAAYRRTCAEIEDDESLATKLTQVFGASVPKDMAGLINFVSENDGLGHVDCPIVQV